LNTEHTSEWPCIQVQVSEPYKHSEHNYACQVYIRTGRLEKTKEVFGDTTDNAVACARILLRSFFSD